MWKTTETSINMEKEKMELLRFQSYVISVTEII